MPECVKVESPITATADADLRPKHLLPRYGSAHVYAGVNGVERSTVFKV